MAKLKNDVQVFIIQQLAQFKTPQEVADLVKSEFNVQIERTQVAGYDPSKIYYRGSEKWKSLFYREREAFLEDIKKIPVANKAYRLQVIQTALNKLLGNKFGTNYKLVIEMLEYSSKEIGGMFTNRRELTGANGKDLLPAEIAREVLREILADGIDRREAIDFVKERYQVSEADILDSELLTIKNSDLDDEDK